MENLRLDYLKEKSAALPLLPGVYIMKDAGGKIIYIGKAKALKKRVSQYFWRFDHHEGKVRRMVEHVDDFEYIITDSEFEALVLECSLIKQNKPKYNILLKDDKGYSYIRITLNTPWPRIESAKQTEDDGALYLGPYISSFAVKEAVDTAQKAFSLPTCSRRFPADAGKGRPCLNYYIHQCCAPCRGRMKESDYRELVDGAVTFLRGGYDTVLKQLKEQMECASEKMEFEKAAKLRDRIESIKKIRERQKVVASKVQEQDVIAVMGDGSNTVVEVFVIRGRRLTDREEFAFEYMQDEEAVLSEFISRYYAPPRIPPKQITLNGKTADTVLLETYLSGQNGGRRVKLIVPQKGEQAALVRMAETNAMEKLNRMGRRSEKSGKVLDELSAALGLSKRAEYIEAYDISNTAGSGVVAGMVVFENGMPLKSAYRRFSIKTVDGQDDYACMREVIGRRLARLKESVKDGGENRGFGREPDLILLDGGRGHVAAVTPVMLEYGYAGIPLFGMVKDNKHRTRAIAANGGEISINENRAVFTLVSKIQDEVHRFAIAYHHNTRKRQTFSSRLEHAPQIGPARAKELMKYFKTLDKIKEAGTDELASVKGMSKTAAELLKVWLENN